MGVSGRMLLIEERHTKVIPAVAADQAHGGSQAGYLNRIFRGEVIVAADGIRRDPHILPWVQNNQCFILQGG